METLPDWDDEGLRPAPIEYAAAPGHDVTSAAHLRAIHDMYRRGLAAVGEIVDRVVQGEADPGEARAAVHGLGLAEAYQQLGSYCGQICAAVRTHHMIEDVALYPQLLAADETLHATLDRLTHEHLVIHEVLERLDAALVDVARDPSRLAFLSTAYQHLRRLLESHFDYEEAALGTALGVHRIGV